ncbi:MAG: hypothetical protein KME09_05905 [Pleurocapsa minor HA4230-MV1]|nr:hypothetical protein [Pleurocapsa minor HA4230-MV1]
MLIDNCNCDVNITNSKFTKITELDEIQNVKEQANSYYTRLSRLLLQIAQSQLAANSATLNLLSQSLAQTKAIADAGQASLVEIKRNWNLI